MRKILVTSALPYANGQIHLGHLVEYIQSDMWVRFQKLRGHDCRYFCADDTHGTPIMISARKAGVSPEEFIAKVKDQHLADFSGFEVEFDHFSSTNTPENKTLSESIFKKMQDNGHIEVRAIQQTYCETDKMFLPDRFVKGTCPNCGALEQYGDSCDVCGATYNPNELKNPHCTICGTSPTTKSSDHIFFKLNDFKDFLQKWIPLHTDKEVGNKLMEWFKEDLRSWDISRDEPYFGFEIPGHKGKYFYVWVDAPIGYMSTSWEWAKKNGANFEDWWKNDKAEIYHFIGKDIAYFHALFWPAMLHNAGFQTPTKIFVHGMLMVNGEKMSKSKGTFVNASTYLKHLDPQYLRFYYASKFSSGVDDIDLSFEDFINRVNSELIGKITNLISRSAQMLSKKMDGKLSSVDAEGEKLLKLVQERSEVIATHFENRDFAKAMIEIRELAEEGNKYVDDKAPWALLKDDPEKARVVITNIVNLYKDICIFLKPILPAYLVKVEKLLGVAPLKWSDLGKKLENQKINDYEHLATRIEKAKTDQIIEDSRQSLGPAAKTAAPLKKGTTMPEGLISIDDFTKVDLRIAKVVEAEAIPEADKLLKLKVKVGDQHKQVFAGIKSKYTPEQILGKYVILVNNLEPRKMRFGMSEGMLLAASGENDGPYLITVDPGAQDGFKVK